MRSVPPCKIHSFAFSYLPLSDFRLGLQGTLNISESRAGDTLSA